jgi:hypothetical protein
VILFFRRCPLALFLPLQALLGFWHLGLMSPWMDEAGTLLTMHRTLGDSIRFAAQDVHPPLYYLLLWGWQRISLGLHWEALARALSVVFGLLATVALDRLWSRGLPERVRWGFLALWSLSPCLLLYSRMSRSYTLQVLLVALAGAFLMRLASAPTFAKGALLTLALLAALYTHYAAGLAVLFAANVILFGRREWGAALAVDVAVAAGYAPWIWHLATSLGSWVSHPAGYHLTGNQWLEIPLKFGYGVMSFTMGEAVPDVLLVCGIVVALVAMRLVTAGGRQYPQTAGFAALVGIAGFIAVVRWVSYPFVPARLLFVLPFLLLLIAAGAGVHRRSGNFVLAAMLVLSATGAWCYFARVSFRNKDYPMPMREIAEYIRQNSTAENSVILVDSTNSDPPALEYALGAERPFLETGSQDSEKMLATRLADHRIHTVWFLHNTHDVSAGGLNARFESRLGAAMRPTIFYYQPYTLLERALMSVMGLPDAPWYFHELVEYRR